MNEDKPDIDRTRLRRVTVVVRSWDGPNSRIGLEMDLNQMPWGPFDALGQELNLLLPTYQEFQLGGPEVETEIAKALRHVEHAADRCGEFAQSSADDREIWLSSQRTWEWLRRHLTRLWIQAEVEGDTAELLGSDEEGPPEGKTREARPEPPPQDAVVDLPSMPGAANTLRAAAQALRTTPLSVWRETVSREDPEAPTREEAIQTILGIAKMLDARLRGEELVIEVDAPGVGVSTPLEVPSAQPLKEEPPVRVDPELEEVSVDFAEGYDQGYRMGRKVGWALGSRHRREPEK
jgi:hypothetical protein